MSAMARMIGRVAAALGCLSLAAAGTASPPPSVVDASTGPASFAEHQAQCMSKDGWSDPAPPVRIFGNVYDVGTCGIVVLLVVGDRGAIMIDGATAEAVPSIMHNLARLGVRPSSVRLLLSTHEHLDHAAGLSEIQRQTGATMIATAAERAQLESGVPAPTDPQREDDRPRFKGVSVERIVEDGDRVRLGSLSLTVHETPGHAPGGTSWSWRSCEGGTCRQVVYADSVSAVSTEAYRFSDHPQYVATLRTSLAKIAALPCDLLITPHPAASALYERLAAKAPLSSSTACRDYASAGRAKLGERLAGERRTTDHALPDL